MLSSEQIAQIISESTKPRFTPNYLVEIKCQTQLDCRCGGKLIEVTSIIAPNKYALWSLGPMPNVKTRRKRKIARLKYRRKFNRLKLAAILIAPLHYMRPTYICDKCGNRMGFYQAIGTNLVKVEPMRLPVELYYLDEFSNDKS